VWLAIGSTTAVRALLTIQYSHFLPGDPTYYGIVYKFSIASLALLVNGKRHNHIFRNISNLNFKPDVPVFSSGGCMPHWYSSVVIDILVINVQAGYRESRALG